MSVDPLTPGDLLTEYRWKQVQAMQRAKEAIDLVDLEFAALFGRHYGGQVDTYRTDDAEFLLITMGSATGTARVAIDQAREEGVPAGLLKIRALRPFPHEKIIEAARGKRVIAVIDRNVCFGWASGAVFMEVGSALNKAGITEAAMLNFIGGLGGSDITVEHIVRIIHRMAETSCTPSKNVSWLGVDRV